MASENKAYAYAGNYVYLDLQNNTMSTIIDPNNDLGTTSTNHMLCANGSVYIVRGAKIVVVDTITQTVSNTITSTIGSITGIAYDENAQLLWAMNSTGKLINIDIVNGSTISSEIVTGVSSPALLREHNGKLYFWNLSSKNLYIYDPANATLPLSAVYTSSLVGGSWSFGYGRSFAIEKSTGNFVICSADGFVAPSKFEVVNGADFSVIGSGIKFTNWCLFYSNCQQ
ncbi:MAG: hypothetical protein M9916_07535 [Crocinitomicaceae bacterium]|nr:hypothetical protein [Crocinitomicaceae bacterium]